MQKTIFVQYHTNANGLACFYIVRSQALLPAQRFKTINIAKEKVLLHSEAKPGHRIAVIVFLFFFCHFFFQKVENTTNNCLHLKIQAAMVSAHHKLRLGRFFPV